MGLERKPDRFSKHLADLRRLDDLWHQGKIADVVTDDEEMPLAWSLAEATELVDTFENLRGLDCGILREKLSTALDGPYRMKDETRTSNIARNTMFEMHVASRLMMRGVDVRLTSTADLSCPIGGCMIYVQCKRPLNRDWNSKEY
jgi:hypothetical protein